jgi:tetratricopeptide (TPR) repeat protein
LDYTHHPQLLLRALLEGATFGEAVMYSNPALSWQGVAIGDPLYRPFKVDLDEQLERSMDLPLSTYLSLRQINRLKAEGEPDEALAYAREQFVRQPTLPMAYRLANLYAANGEIQKATEALRLVRYMSNFVDDDVVLVQEIANLLHQYDESALALDLYQQLIARKGQAKALRIRLLEGGAKIATEQGQVTLASGWTLTARKLKQPPVKVPAKQNQK